MNLYFQFFTREQSAAAIDLIRLPALLVTGQTIAGETKMSAGGKCLSSSFSSIDALSTELATTRFNELEVIYAIGEVKMGNIIAQAKSLNGVFYPSPSCKLWFASKDFPRPEDRRSVQREMNAKAKEESLTDDRVTMKPVAFEAALEIKTSESAGSLLDGCAELFSISSKVFDDLEVFGCCDAGGKEMLVSLETRMHMLEKIRVVRRISPTAYPELGDKFEDLHPLMFGAKRVCSELAAALGNDAKLICGPIGSDFAVIRLSPKCDIAAARERAKDWLLPTIR